MFPPLSLPEGKPSAQAGCCPARPARCRGWAGMLSASVVPNFSRRRHSSRFSPAGNLQCRPAAGSCGLPPSGAVPCPAGTCGWALASHQSWMNRREREARQTNKHFSVPASCRRCRSRLLFPGAAAASFCRTISQLRGFVLLFISIWDLGQQIGCGGVKRGEEQSGPRSTARAASGGDPHPL